MLFSNKWKPIIRFFGKAKEVEKQELSDPVPVRIPVAVLEEVTNQANEIGGSRYRSKHITDLIEIGCRFYRISSEKVNGLPIEHINLLMRLHYVFNDMNLEVEKVAEKLGHENFEKVALWMNGSVMPSFKDLSNFAQEYFINEEWLKYGNKEAYQVEFTPYIVKRQSFHHWGQELKEILSEFNGKKPTFIQLIRSDKGRFVVSISYDKSELVRTINYSNIRLRDENDVGSGGFSDLVNLTMLCLVLYKHIHDNGPIISYSISDADMELITTGQKTPKQIDVYGQNHANIWYESIFDTSDTLKTEQCWKGSRNLFLALQASKQFVSCKSDFEQDPKGKIKELLE